MNDMKHLGATFIGGLILGGLIVALWFFSSSVPRSTTGALIPPDESGRVSVLNQEAGESVLVESVTVPPPGVWVTVHEVQGNGLGNILGAARARAPASGFVIPLLRATVQTGSYAIVLYRDDGDDAFELDRDSLYVDFDTGVPVIAPFTTQ
jgi:hypothetical protein